MQSWREWLDDATSTDQGTVYRWLRGDDPTPPVVFLPREDGTARSQIPEMDALLQRAWGPIGRKYADRPQPDVNLFMGAYGHHLRCVPKVTAPRTRERLSQRARAMKPSTLGLDGWALQDLRTLPPDLMDWLAALLGFVERTGRWPGALTPGRLTRGYTALVPKEGPPGALNTRPLTVLSIFYRLWAGARLQEAMAWQERWAHPRAFGFWPARSATDGAAMTQLLLELGRLKGWTVSGMGLDYRKCFDLMPQVIVFEVCTRLGWDDEVLAALHALYCQLVRAFKLAGGLGGWWRATNGILQGCPLSVILINALMGVWKAELDSLREQVVVVTRDLPPCSLGPG